ncbi:MAG: precorrin-3B C(17)-methyltransferase [Lachnospiraceae bacterium]
MGPGSYEEMTIRAVKALESCEVIVGYTVYIDLVQEYFKEKEFLTTPMRKEVERCHLALEQAALGKTTGMICSGDAGVYGMSGLILEIGIQYPQVKVEIIPGVTAALSGGAVLGAPLMHDFVVISLSDLMTPWETIARRLRVAAQGDFVICLYNPSSKKRGEYLRRACEILLEEKDNATPCGTVSRIGREGESMALYSLKDLKEIQTDMFTTVFIGNSTTKVVNGKLVTPRGYEILKM